MWKRLTLAGTVLVAIISCVTAKSLTSTDNTYQPIYESQQENAGPRTVGTFKRTEILIAYYRSDVHDRYIRCLRNFNDTAIALGREDLQAHFEQVGATSQEIAHLQLAGKAPLTNIVAVLKEALPAVAEAAGVDALCEEGQAGKGNTTKDVTSLLEEILNPEWAAEKKSAASVLPEPKMQGRFQGESKIIVSWCEQDKLPIDLTVHDDGTVTGQVGDATIKQGVLKENSKLLQMLGNKPYLICADLDGALVEEEGIERNSLQLIVRFDENGFHGGFHSSGSKLGGKKSMMFSGMDVVLNRVN